MGRKVLRGQVSFARHCPNYIDFRGPRKCNSGKFFGIVASLGGVGTYAGRETGYNHDMTAKPTKKIGRPPKPAAEKQGVRLRINLTAAEAELVARAAGEGQVAEWCRTQIVRAAKRAAAQAR